MDVILFKTVRSVHILIITTIILITNNNTTNNTANNSIIIIEACRIQENKTITL